METYEKISISPDHWILTESDGRGYVCMHLLIGNHKALLIDTGYGFGDIKSEIDKITQLPLIIVNTHAHTDHSGGNYLFGLPAYMHSEDICTFIIRERPIHPDHVQSFAPIPITDGDCIDIGGRMLTVLHTPGHTPGGISLHDTKTGTLYAGDCVGPSVLLWRNQPDAVHSHFMTMKRLLQSDITTVHPGHQVEGIPADRLHEFYDTAQKALHKSNFMELPDACGYICVCDKYENEIKGKNMSMIYENYVSQPDFSCIFLLNA